MPCCGTDYGNAGGRRLGNSVVRSRVDRYRVLMPINSAPAIHGLALVLLGLTLSFGQKAAMGIPQALEEPNALPQKQDAVAPRKPRGPVRDNNRLQFQRAAASNEGLDLKKVMAVGIPSEVQRLLGQLAVDDFAVRTEATMKLRRHPVPDESLMAALARGGLLEEQRVRLLGILEWRILNRSRGAVGVKMTARLMGQEPRGIEISEVLPGLPAERVLKVGDVLQRLNGQAALRNEDLILQVQQMRPGEKIKVDLLRPVRDPEPGQEDGLAEFDGVGWFEQVEVEIVLGSYEQLNEDPRQANAETRRRENFVAVVRATWGNPADVVVIDPEGQSKTVGESRAP